jgi:hypothetical protein
LRGYAARNERPREKSFAPADAGAMGGRLKGGHDGVYFGTSPGMTEGIELGSQ